MMLIDQERPFRLRPQRPARTRTAGAWPAMYRAVLRHARMSGARRRALASRGAKATARHFQRCAVRVTYTRNAVRGQWGAHGRYLDREAARCPRSASFNERGESTETARQLSAWQKVGDPQIWKLIISPEFGERIDLRKLTAELMRRIEVDRGGANLEWVAAAHYNTEHPHVHVALRGVDGAGEAVRFGRDFIKQGIRELAANLCTQQIGYRSELDAAAAR